MFERLSICLYDKKNGEVGERGDGMGQQRLPAAQGPYERARTEPSALRETVPAARKKISSTPLRMSRKRDFDRPYPTEKLSP